MFPLERDNKTSHHRSSFSLARALIYIYISCLFPQSQFAEPAGYFSSTSFEELVMNAKEPITFADSVTGKRRQRDAHLVPTYSSSWEETHELNEQPTTNALFSSCLVVLWTCFFFSSHGPCLVRETLICGTHRSIRRTVCQRIQGPWMVSYYSLSELEEEEAKNKKKREALRTVP